MAPQTNVLPGKLFGSVLPLYLAENIWVGRNRLTPGEYFRWMFPLLVEHRLPLYEAIAQEYG
ncbi:MAG: hypothetical protein CM1200mP18_07520 [Gammaproteobacteria bacterium]|nr:MAG: hypothetical protein CM1200mP18_07520 [Gammaproteobacteria bacterium]